MTSSHAGLPLLSERMDVQRLRSSRFCSLLSRCLLLLLISLRLVGPARLQLLLSSAIILRGVPPDSPGLIRSASFDITLFVRPDMLSPRRLSE